MNSFFIKGDWTFFYDVKCLKSNVFLSVLLDFLKYKEKLEG